MDWRQELQTLVREGEVRLAEPMSAHTSFKIGGPADALVLPGSRDELRRVLDFAIARQLPRFILGRGTNLLVRDGGLRGLVLKIGGCFRQLHFEGDEILAGAGLSLAELAGAAAGRGLAGLAFAAGIPGTLGGGIFMNAGAYGGELAQVVENVTAYYPGRGETAHGKAELALSYRTSRFQREEAIIEAVRLRLTPGNTAAIKAEMADFARRRQEKQPLHLPSAGSVFRRPPGNYAGTLIEQAGLKGARVGGAEVSEMHANFIVNTGSAKASDVLELIAMVQTKVKEATGLELEPEIRVVGED